MSSEPAAVRVRVCPRYAPRGRAGLPAEHAYQRVRALLLFCEEDADGVVGEEVADDPAITFSDDDLGGAQVAESLRHRGVVQAGRCGQVRDADRPGGADAGQQGEPGGIGEHGIVLRLAADRFGVAEGGDGAADPFLVDDPMVGPVGGQKVHHCSLPEDQVNS